MIGLIPIVSTVMPYQYSLSDFVGADTNPANSDTLMSLLTGDTAYQGLDIERRAIGSLLHLVQDSYARGHTRRTLLNPEDLSGAPDDDEFLPGKWGRYGAVENFHCYRGQNPDQHKKYDRPPKGIVLRPEFADSFNPLLGARDAVDASAKLLGMWNNQTPWDAPDGPQAYLEGTVFKLAANAKPADNTVVPPPGIP